MYALADTSSIPTFTPVRGVSADVLPAPKHGRPYSFTFFNTPAPVTRTTEAAMVIMERNGIFCIADFFEPSPVTMDLEFKGLVDSVMSR